MTYEAGDIVLVPFPFTDLSTILEVRKDAAADGSAFPAMRGPDEAVK